MSGQLAQVAGRNIQLNDRVFDTVSELFQYISTLSTPDQLNAVEKVRSIFTRASNLADQVLHDIYDWILTWPEADLGNFDQQEAWRMFREAHGRVRNRKKEGKDALAGEGKWCTPVFWDDVIVPLTGASTDVVDALRKIKKKDIGPIEVMQRGCLEMFNRLSGRSKTRTRKDRFCTGGDLKTACLGERGEKFRVEKGEWYASLLSRNLTIDVDGFIWHQPPAQSVGPCVEQQRLHEAAQRSEAAGKLLVGKEVVGSTIQPRKRKDVEDDVNKTGRSAPVPSFRRPAKRTASTHARNTSEMDQIFNQLNVVKDAVSRSRAASLKKKGKTTAEPLSPTRMQIPVKNATKVQTSLWEVIDKRARAVKEKRHVDVSKQAQDAMRLPPSQLVQEIGPIANGLRNAKEAEDTMLVYTQCLIDAWSSQIIKERTQTSEMSQLRTLLAKWHNEYRERNVRLIPGSLNEGGVELDHYDLSSLLIGDGHSGWLNGDLIHGVLNLLSNRERHYIVPALAWSHWHGNGNHPNDIFYVPDHYPSLVVMIHWGNHWAIGIADRTRSTLNYLDSMPTSGRQQMAMSSLRNFVQLHPGYNSIAWQNGTETSVLQANAIDCGVWAIFNAVAWMEGQSFPEQVGLAERLYVGDVVLNAARATQPVPAALPTDELEILGSRNLTPSMRRPSETPKKSTGDLVATAKAARERMQHSPTPMTPLISTGSRQGSRAGSEQRTFSGVPTPTGRGVRQQSAGLFLSPEPSSQVAPGQSSLFPLSSLATREDSTERILRSVESPLRSMGLMQQGSQQAQSRAATPQSQAQPQQRGRGRGQTQPQPQPPPPGPFARRTTRQGKEF